MPNRCSPFRWPCLIASVALLAACNELTPLSSAAEPPERQLTVSAASAIVVSGGFALPESVVHDAVADVYLVSNMGTGANPLALDGDGFISRIAPDGTVIDWRWIDGAAEDVTLHGPFGLMIHGDVLYVVDRDALRAFDRATGAPLGVVHAFPYTMPFTQGSVAMLNDVCRGPDGALYVTDTGLTLDDGGNFVPTGTDAVYRIAGGVATAVASGEETMGPNGCVTMGANVVWTTFKSNQLLTTNPSGRIRELSALPAGGIDSAVRVGGFLYVSSWDASGIYRISVGGAGATFVRGDLPTPGDLGFDEQRQRLLVPLVFSNEVHILPL